MVHNEKWRGCRGCLMCTITDEEITEFEDGWGATPCEEYGMCEDCTYFESEVMWNETD